MIAVRKEISAFADFNNRALIPVDNPHLFVFSRFNLRRAYSGVLVVGNFDARPQYLDLNIVNKHLTLQHRQVKDLYSGDTPAMFKDQLVIPPYHFYWLSD
jgi:amylosucrase